MAIVWLIMAFQFLPMPDEARLQKLEFLCTDFSKAEALALEDFEKGKYHLVLSGEKYSSYKTYFLDSILRAEYNIEVLYTGCIGTTDEVYHYMFVMAFQLANDHGHNFFDRARKKAFETPSPASRFRFTHRDLRLPLKVVPLLCFATSGICERVTELKKVCC
jgi:hypothetical protein